MAMHHAPPSVSPTGDDRDLSHSNLSLEAQGTRTRIHTRLALRDPHCPSTQIHGGWCVIDIDHRIVPRALSLACLCCSLALLWPRTRAKHRDAGGSSPVTSDQYQSDLARLFANEHDSESYLGWTSAP